MGRSLASCDLVIDRSSEIFTIILSCDSDLVTRLCLCTNCVVHELYHSSGKRSKVNINRTQIAADGRKYARTNGRARQVNRNKSLSDYKAEK